MQAGEGKVVLTMERKHLGMFLSFLESVEGKSTAWEGHAEGLYQFRKAVERADRNIPLWSSGPFGKAG